MVKANIFVLSEIDFWMISPPFELKWNYKYTQGTFKWQLKNMIKIENYKSTVIQIQFINENQRTP